MLWGEVGGCLIYRMGKGRNEMILIFYYFLYLVFSVFVSMSFGILHHLLLLSETGRELG